MAVIIPRQIDGFKGKLIIEIDYAEATDLDGHVADMPLFVDVYYEPSPEMIKQSGKNTDDLDSFKKKILEIYTFSFSNTPNEIEFTSALTIYPINTAPNNRFMQPKYAQIESITLTGFDFGFFPETIEQVEDILENLPSGFVKNYDYGLGLQKDYRFIINAIEENTDIKHLTISKNEKTCTEAASIFNNEEVSYNLNYDEYEAIRRGIDNITRNYQSEGRIDKSIFAYNALLNISNPAQYPEKYRPYKKDTILKFISSNDLHQADLSASDQKEIVNLISKNKNALAEHQPKALMKLHDDIELVTLERLIKKF